MNKYVIICLAVYAIISGCASATQIGKVNMISNRNIDSKVDYVSLKTYVGSTKKEQRKLKGATIEQAIDNVVRDVPGGEYLKNVKIYRIKNYYAVEGDVWGIATNINVKGFKVFDRVQYKDKGKNIQGTITQLLNSTECSVKIDTTGEVKIISVEKLLKID